LSREKNRRRTEMAEAKEKKYSGYGYHGGGRKPTGRVKIYANTTISGLPEEIEALKALAKSRGKTLSRLVVETLLQKQ
jgi:hypothetical protein